MLAKFSLTCLIFSGLNSFCFADEAGLKTAISEWKLSSEAWTTEWMAASPERKEILAKSQPDAIQAGRKIWGEMKGNLSKPWSIDGICWLLERPAVVRGLWPKAQDRQKAENGILTILEKHFLKRPEIARAIPGLMAISNPKSKVLIESIRTTHPDVKVRGVASLALALMLKPAGFSQQIIRNRLTYLREAILYSINEPFQQSSVKEIAEEELYFINNLLSGRKAPDFSCKTNKKANFQLSQNKGKTTVLIFWKGNSLEELAALEMAANLQKKLTDKGLSTIALTPIAPSKPVFDDLIDARDENAKIARIYRVSQTPWTFIINSRGEIVHNGALDMETFLIIENLVSPVKETPKPSPKKPNSAKPGAIYDPDNFDLGDDDFNSSVEK